MLRKVKRDKRKKKALKKKEQAKKSARKIKPATVFIYALALAALGGGGFLVYDQVRRRKAANSGAQDNQDTIVINNNIPALTSSVSRRITTSTTDGFALKRGSRGTLVTMLQKALVKSGSSIKVDGQFGSGTASALKAAGYPEVIDEPTFNKITGSSTNVQVVFNPVDLATRLYKAAQSKSINTVLSTLSEIKSVQDYSSVNEYYKKQTYFISRTIVTDLLEYAFKSDEAAKQQIRNEFLRIGLKADVSGRWSLQGIRLFKDLITIRQTVVTDAQSNRIPVRRNTILGEEIEVANGITWFRSVDNTILKVPTQDVKYT